MGIKLRFTSLIILKKDYLEYRNLYFIKLELIYILNIIKQSIDIILLLSVGKRYN